jgi:hypothetical protein
LYATGMSSKILLNQCVMVAAEVPAISCRFFGQSSP